VEATVSAAETIVFLATTMIDEATTSMLFIGAPPSPGAAGP